MRDDDLAFIDAMQRDLRDVRWAEPAELRARARRRSRRTVAAAAVAVLALTSGAAFVASGRAASPARAPVAANPSATPWSATEVPAEALLQPSDVRPAGTTPWNDSGLDEEIQLDKMLEVCRQEQGLRTEWVKSRYSRSVTLLRKRPGAGDQSAPQAVVLQDVHRLAPQDGERLFDELPALLAPCRTWRFTGPVELKGKRVQAEVVHSWQTVDSGFAGDESVLVRHAVGQGRRLDTGARLGDGTPPKEQVVVRVGDLVTVLSTGPGGDEVTLRDLARVAAERLCRATNPGC